MTNSIIERRGDITLTHRDWVLEGRLDLSLSDEHVASACAPQHPLEARHAFTLDDAGNEAGNAALGKSGEVSGEGGFINICTSRFAGIRKVSYVPSPIQAMFFFGSDQLAIKCSTIIE